MASSAKSLPLLLLLALLSSQISYARDSQFFSKIPAATTNPTAKASVVEVNPNRQQEPTFIPADTQNYYGHESGQLSETSTSTVSTTTTSEPYTAAKNFRFETQSQEPYSYYNKHAYVTKPQGYVPTNRFFNTHPQNGGYTAGTTASYNNYYNSQQMGLSDTRFLENGKYYYDPKSEYSNKGYYGNNENSYQYRNSMEGFQNQEQIPEIEDLEP